MGAGRNRAGCPQRRRRAVKGRTSERGIFPRSAGVNGQRQELLWKVWGKVRQDLGEDGESNSD
jgi:hypothetical protein